jgi:putative ABC transport system permease protein
MLTTLIDNATLQGLLYGGAAVGLFLGFRVLRYPDLTADGSFLIGAAVAAAAVTEGFSWITALFLSAVSGSAAGGFTGLIHFKAGVSKILSGILTSMICYSLSFHVLGSRATVGLERAGLFSLLDRLDAGLRWGYFPHPTTLLFLAAWGISVVLGLAMLLTSDLGLLLRSAGVNPSLIVGLGRRPALYLTLGLAVANALISSSGALVALHQQFVDVNMGVGLVVTLTAAVALGDRIVRVAGLDPARRLAVGVTTGFVGMIAYYVVYLLVLRFSLLGWLPLRIEPSDIKLVSALLVIAVSMSARRKAKIDEPTIQI